MPQADESAELRMLRAKAYGPGGGLTAEELARLQELEGEERLRRFDSPRSLSARPHSESDRVVERAEGPPPVVERVEGDPRVVERAEGETKRVERPEGVETSEAPHHPEAPPATPRRRWPILAAASAAILAIGLGIGWGIWGWDGDASALAAAHGGTQAELEAGERYDPGTIVPLAEQYGVVVWSADRSDGDETCVIVTGSTTPRDGCVPTGGLKDSVWPNATATVPEGEEKAGQQLNAGLIPTPTGELVPFIQVWDQSQSDWESRYSDEELTQLREIEAAGYQPEQLSIIGYDGDTVVWGTWETGLLCIIVPINDALAEQCAADADSDVELTASAGGIVTEYHVTQSTMRPPQLTVIKHASADARSEYYYGNPDEPMFDDLVDDFPAIDDKTGE
ncbi:hypothetical protein [Microbacterium sp.]|uniref:hypothetical protein n=1 Tax=Microbacterium sp. TaxID=51671 RepID=UPI003F9AA2E4